MVGCWVSVFGTALAVALVFTLMVTFGESGAEFLGALIVAGLPALLVASVLTALGLLVFGVPATWLLVRLGRESGLAYVLAGAAGGALVGLVWMLVAANGAAIALLAGAAPGALCGWLWWRFARRDRQQSRTEVAETFE